jgi:hypothetical protein
LPPPSAGPPSPMPGRLPPPIPPWPGRLPPPSPGPGPPMPGRLPPPPGNGDGRLTFPPGIAGRVIPPAPGLGRLVGIAGRVIPPGLGRLPAIPGPPMAGRFWGMDGRVIPPIAGRPPPPPPPPGRAPPPPPGRPRCAHADSLAPRIINTHARGRIDRGHNMSNLARWIKRPLLADGSVVNQQAVRLSSCTSRSFGVS